MLEVVKGVKNVPKLKKCAQIVKKMRSCRGKEGESMVGSEQGLSRVVGGVEGGVGGG